VNLPQYLANMDKLANAVAGAQKFHLAPGEKSLVALVRPPPRRDTATAAQGDLRDRFLERVNQPQRNLYRMGMTRLEEEFRSLLDRAAPPLETAANQVHQTAQAALAAKGAWAAAGHARGCCVSLRLTAA